MTSNNNRYEYDLYTPPEPEQPNGQYTDPQYANAPQQPTQQESLPVDPTEQTNHGYDGFTVAGLICSFFFPVVGLILSIIGLNRVKRNGKKSKTFAILGIIIGAVLTVTILYYAYQTITLLSSMNSLQYTYTTVS